MNWNNRSFRSAALLSATFASLVSLVLSISGCATFGRGEAVRPTATLQAIQDDYGEAIKRTEATKQALDAVDLASPADMPQVYGEFKRKVGEMQIIGKKVVTHVDELQYQGASYVVSSRKSAAECRLPAARNGQPQEPVEGNSYLDEVSDDAGTIKRAYDAFDFDLNQLSGYLSRRLNLAALDAIKPIILKARVDAESLKWCLAEAQTDLEEAKAVQNQNP